MMNLIACATCANNFVDQDTNAAGWAILFMLGVVLPILASIVFFMVRLARRANANLDPELCDDFDPSSH